VPSLITQAPHIRPLAVGILVYLSVSVAAETIPSIVGTDSGPLYSFAVHNSIPAAISVAIYVGAGFSLWRSQHWADSPVPPPDPLAVETGKAEA
jgi:hypothetical protein